MLPKYTPQSPKVKTEMILTTPEYSQKTQTFPSSIQMNGCDTPLSTSVRNLGVALDQTLFPATPIPYVRLAISSSVESVLSVTISPTTLLSVLSFCLIFITVIHFLQGAPKIWSVNFRKFIIMLPTSSVILPGLTTYLWSFVFYTSFLLNPVFNQNNFFLPLNHWPTRPLPIFSDLIQLYIPSVCVCTCVCD